MDAKNDPDTRGTVATIVATAAVTLALGVTAAAFGGYLRSDRATPSEPAAQVEPAAAEPAAPMPTFVVVPVPTPAVVDPVAEPVLAVYEDGDGDDDHDDEDHEHADDDDD